EGGKSAARIAAQVPQLHVGLDDDDVECVVGLPVPDRRQEHSPVLAIRAENRRLHPRQRFVIGVRRSRPNAFGRSLTPGGACRRLYSARSIIASACSTTSASKPSEVSSSRERSSSTYASRTRSSSGYGGSESSSSWLSRSSALGARSTFVCGITSCLA